MPNGGILPSCFVCEWKEKQQQQGLGVGQIYCTRHKMNIALPMHTFCPSLLLPGETSEPSRFIQRSEITGQDVYHWFEKPYGLMYVHEYVRLTSIENYRTWTQEERIAASRRLDKEKEREVDAAVGSEVRLPSAFSEYPEVPMKEVSNQADGDHPVMNEERYRRSLASLDGLSVGDAFGEYFFVRKNGRLLWKPGENLPSGPWHYSDDTMMALSIVSILRQYGEIDQDRLAENFARHFERSRGYGPGMRRLLARIAEGDNWREVAKKLFQAEGSFGNGGAMRAAPLGAYFSEHLATVVEQATRATEVTHAHPEGIAGGVAVALAAAVAGQALSQKVRPSPADYLDSVIAHIPDSQVRQQVQKARDLPPDAPVEQAIEALGNGRKLTAQDTVGFTLWCAAKHLDSYEDALWLTVRGGGDADTNSAIVGGIVAAYTGSEGIPAEWLSRRESLPTWAFAE